MSLSTVLQRKANVFVDGYQWHRKRGRHCTAIYNWRRQHWIFFVPQWNISVREQDAHESHWSKQPNTVMFSYVISKNESEISSFNRLADWDIHVLCLILEWRNFAEYRRAMKNNNLLNTCLFSSLLSKTFSTGFNLI